MMPASKSSKKKKSSSASGKAGKAQARKKAPAKAAATRKTTARKTTARKAPARKTSVKKSSAKKTSAKKAPAKKSPARKAAGKKAPAKKAARKAVPKKAPAKKKAAAKPAAVKAPARKPAAKKAAPGKAPSKKAASAGRKALAKKKALAIKPEQPEPSFAFSGPLKAFKPYQPSPREEYMSEAMRAHFRRILIAWQQELMEEVDRTVHHMKDEAANFPDPNDRATQESEFGLELRTRDRERKLQKKIEQALARLDDGTYGYCSETGEEIGLRRLEARPVATLTVEAQERRELAEKQYRDRDDR
jgi:DnaK suppressor protein